MKRFCAVWLVAWLLVWPVWAQSPQVQGNLTSATCPGTGCLTLAVAGLAGVAIQISGTYSGTVSFEATVDGSTYVALNLSPLNSAVPASSTTSTGVWSGGVGGASIVRARMSSYTSGTAVVSIKAAPTSARGLGGSGGGGAPIDATYLTQIADATLTNEFPIGADPNADRIVFWDDSASGFTYLTAGTNLSITGTTINAAGSAPGGSDTQVQFNDSSAFGGDSGFVFDKTDEFISLGNNYAVVDARTNPGVHIGSNVGDSGALLVLGSDDENTGYPTIDLVSSNGTTAAPTDSLTGNDLGEIRGRGYLANAFNGGSVIHFTAASVSDAVYGGLELRANTTGLGMVSYLTINGFTNTLTVPFGFVVSDGQALRTDTTTAHTACFASVYDVNGTAYVCGVTGTNGDTPDLTISTPTGGTMTVAPSTLTIPSGTSLVGGTVTSRYVSNGTTPGVSDTSANSCGSGTQTIVGNDNAGKVTVIGSVGTSCTVTFATAFANAPSCSVTNETTANLSRATSTTTTVILAGTFLENDVLAYGCLGR